MIQSPLEFIGIQAGRVIVKDEMGVYHSWSAEETMVVSKVLMGALFEYHAATGRLIGEAPDEG